MSWQREMVAKWKECQKGGGWYPIPPECQVGKLLDYYDCDLSGVRAHILRERIQDSFLESSDDYWDRVLRLFDEQVTNELIVG